MQQAITPPIHFYSTFRLPYLFGRIFLSLTILLLAACGAPPKPPPIGISQPLPPKIALVLGGGGTRGFAHIGVIKALEAQGIVPDIIVGTSAGSVVGTLYAAGYSGFELQKFAIPMQKREEVINWIFSKRGISDCEKLQDFINLKVRNYPIEKLKRPVAVVATNLHSGRQKVFRAGNVGIAVCASSAVPGVFVPININGLDYVDGGLVSPIPVSVARSLGAKFVIAVDISNSPFNNRTEDIVDILFQTFDIMSQAINRRELQEADITISPVTAEIDPLNLNDRHTAILEGEKAASAKMTELKNKLKKLDGN